MDRDRHGSGEDGSTDDAATICLAHLVAPGPGSAEPLRWGAVADLFGHYLATGVVADVMWAARRPLGRSLADFATLSAFG